MERTRTAVERHLLHFDASKDKRGDRVLTYYAGMTPHRVHAHTRSTLADARVGNPLLQKLPDAQFSHYLEVDLPSDSVMMTYLACGTEVDGSPTEDFLSLAVHVPRAGRQESVARRGLLSAGMDDIHPKLAWLLGDDAVEGTLLRSLLRPGRFDPESLHDLIDPFETATSLLFQHPGLINLSSDNGGQIPAIILEQCVGRALRFRGRNLLNAIRDLGPEWSRRVPLLDDGKVVTDKEGTVFTIEVHERVRRFMSEPMGLALKYSQQLQELEGQTWRVQYGKTVDEHKPLKAAAIATRPVLRADQSRWTLKALSRMNGVSTGSVSFQPPREGGWTIKEIWSSDDAVPMNAETVAALAEGRMFARVDTAAHEGAWTGTFAAQVLKDDETATFAAKHQSNRSGADFATVALSLDALRLDLTVDLKVTSKSTTDALTSVNLFIREPSGLERKVWSARPSIKGQYGNLRVDVINEWMRHLGAYAEFYDAAEKLITPAGWSSKMPLNIAPDFDKHATKKYIDVLAPVDNVFGIPLGPMTTTLDIPVPAEAASVKLYWGGLGTGEYDDTVCACGITCTAVLELALPVIMLIQGSSLTDSKFINNMMKDPKVRYGIYSLGVALIGGGAGGYIGVSQDPGKAAGTVATKLLPALAKLGLKKLSIYLAEKAAEGVAKRSIPLIGLAFLAFDTAVTLLQLGQTIAAVVQSPFYYTTKLTRTFDLRGRVLPDPAFNKFPDHHDRMVVQVLYDAGNALPVQEQRLPAETLSKPLPFEFLNIAAGGRIKVIVIFYAANGWQSALGASSWIDAKGANGSATLDIDVTVKNALIPLSKDSVYQHRQALAYEGGKHRWKQGPAPTTTITTVSPDAGHRLLSLGGITVAQRPGMLAYSWQATGLNLPRDRPGAPSDEAMFAMQNISLLEDPEAGCAVTPIGFTLPCGVAYDIGSSEDGSGANYYLDPSLGEFDAKENLAGGYHIRRIALSLGAKPRFEPGSKQSWGRFPRAVDGFLVHPQGYAVAVSADTSKLYILALPRQAGENTRATMASMYSGEGERVGLMKLPRAVAVALDGRLLVLEEGNRRIQCFDISGNPVPYFKQAGSSEKSAILSLRATAAQSTRYLDLAVEAKGYVFVLACDENGSTPEQYRVDIYEPDGSFLVSTPRVAAARIAVDLARSLYTLNWETWIGADGRTEPSVSMWLPPPPKMRAGKGKQ
ncbi:hypothetical protein ACN9MB_10770 [Dyella kyungheensis]|uniref:hypothetical protein n=1 Tax=Dyella kyungheensis TaxID=1242174 RepID=UPI003CE86C13